MWAEWRRATGGMVAPQDDPRWVCRMEVDLSVLDLRDAAARQALGVTLRDLAADWSPGAPNPAAMRVAAAARELGVDGMIVPSAARDGGWNLAVLPHALDRVQLAARRRAHPPSR